MIMVWVTEWLEPQPQVPKGASTSYLGSQDTEPMEEAVGSQHPEPSPALEPHLGSQLPKPTSGPVGHTTCVGRGSWI
jgi:hypothetical protein